MLHRPDYTCPIHNNTTTAQHLHSCTGGPTGLNGRGSIQTLWGPRHSKSGGTEQEEGEGAHFPPKEHQSLKKTSFFKKYFLFTVISICILKTPLHILLLSTISAKSSYAVHTLCRGKRRCSTYPALGVWEPVPIVQIPPPAWEVGGPEKASQKGELFESSVIQKRPFNVRTWGSRRKCRWHRSKLLKQQRL